MAGAIAGGLDLLPKLLGREVASVLVDGVPEAAKLGTYIYDDM